MGRQKPLAASFTGLLHHGLKSLGLGDGRSVLGNEFARAAGLNPKRAEGQPQLQRQTGESRVRDQSSRLP